MQMSFMRLFECETRLEPFPAKDKIGYFHRGCYPSFALPALLKAWFSTPSASSEVTRTPRLRLERVRLLAIGEK